MGDEEAPDHDSSSAAGRRRDGASDAIQVSDEQVRLALPTDADAIASIHVRAWQAAFRGLVPDSLLDHLAVEHRALAWRGLLLRAEATTWVVERGGRVLGFASAAAVGDPALGGAGELKALYVEPAELGTGLGHALLERALDGLRAAGHRSAVLWVLPGNERAIAFYERAGFERDGREQEIRAEHARLPVVGLRRELA